MPDGQKKEKVLDSCLCDAVDEIRKGLIDADLGGGLIKKRVARQGSGKRGGHRTLIAFQSPGDISAFFIFGFSKNERDNIDLDEKEVYKKLAKFYLDLNTDQLNKLIAMNKLFEVKYG